MPDDKRPSRSWTARVIWITVGGLGLAAVVWAVIFATTHTNGTSGPSDVSTSNVQPQSSVLIIYDCGEGSDDGVFEPATINLACGDGTIGASNLAWSEWNSTTAVGQGTLNEVSCIPNCAEGKDVAYRAKLTLSEPVRAGSGKEYFTRVTVTYIGKGPGGSATQVFKDCFDSPPAPFIPACPADEQGAS